MKFFHLWILLLYINAINAQSGPDPWNSGNDERQTPTYRRKSSDIKSNSGGIGEWSFKRLVAIMLKPNQIKKNEDNTIDVNVRMKFSSEKWRILEEYFRSDVTFTEDMFRRTLGYVEEAIYKPSITETLTTAWSDYVQIYLTMYKIHITLTFGILSVLGFVLWMWNRMSQKHVLVVILLLLYFYEVVVSYKEAEQQEVQRFISAMNTCKWYFWTDQCDVPSPDLLVFMKHMNPGKIAIKMFTNWISEPLIGMSTTIKTIINGITDGLWFPFDVIVYGILTVGINIMLIILFIMVIFNYFFNIPFNLGLPFLNVGILQRQSTNASTVGGNDTRGLPDINRIGGAALDRFLDICSRAVDTATTTRHTPAAPLTAPNNLPRIRRSASTGRLPNFNNSEHDSLCLTNSVRRRHNFRMDGSGDS